MPRTRSAPRWPALPLALFFALASSPPAFAAALGDLNQQLVFTPITPCRIIDTRLAGGAFAAGATRSYTIGGVTNYSSTGGNPAGCGIPGAEGFPTSHERVRAYAFNVVAVGPAGPGHLVAWPANKAMPTASTLNYAPSGGLNVANGVIVASCDGSGTLGNPVCPGGDVKISAAISPTHVVVDVQGYFTRAADESVRSVVAHASGSGSDLMTAPECRPLTSCTVLVPSGVSGIVVSQGLVVVEFKHDTVFETSMRFVISETSGDCSADVLPGAGQFSHHSLGTPAGYVGTITLPVLQRFLSPAAGNRVYFLNGSGFADDAFANVTSSQLICTFHPG